MRPCGPVEGLSFTSSKFAFCSPVIIWLRETKAPTPSFVSVFALRNYLGDYSHLQTVLLDRLAGDGSQAEIQERMI